MELKLTAERAGRLSSFLKAELRMSTGLMNRLKWGDSIRVNGIPQHTDHPVSCGDLITVALEEEPVAYPAEEGPLTVVYEDDWLMAVDKPAGMLIHPSHSINSGTLANLVQGHYSRGGQSCAFHPLTRLDRDTYGIVLIAKNSHMSALLQASRPEKYYHAVTFGIPKEYNGVIEAPIARRPLPSLLREVNPEGKPCRTEYRVVDTQSGFARLELKPITGRTHQLRIHCAHIGCPILGDPQYGSPDSTAYSASLGISSQLLCARIITLIHPVTGQRLTLESCMDALYPEQIQKNRGVL